MVLFIILSIAALMGIRNGIAKKIKTWIVSSATVLILIAMISFVYLYLYSKNPY